MRATEQIDAIEALSVDSFEFLVVPRVLACVMVLPLLTIFSDFSGLLGGYLSEYGASHISVSLYMGRAFQDLTFENFIPSTIKLRCSALSSARCPRSSAIPRTRGLK